MHVMKNIKINLIGGLLLVGAFACDDTEENAVDITDVAGSVEDYARMTAVLNELESAGLTGIENDEATEGVIGGRTTFTQDCITVTTDRAEDGRITYSYDFGTGCDVHETRLAGKVTISTSFNEHDSFEQRTNYENLALNDWSIDGEEMVFGSFSQEGEGMFSFDVNYDIDKNLTVVACDGISYNIISSEAVLLTDESKTISSYEQTIESNDLVYETSVETPLVLDYACNRREVYTYTQGVIKTVFGAEEFVLDYGDGTCDNLVLVTEDGITQEKEASELASEEKDWCVTG